jgi:hypothetical protein
VSAEDPKRLLEDSLGDAGVRALLEAGKSEVPTQGQLVALAAKLAVLGGLGGAGAAGAAGAGSAGAGSAGAGSAGSAGAAGAAGSAGAAASAGAAVKVGLAFKVVGALAVVSVAGTGAVVATRSVESHAPVGLVATTASPSAAREGRSAPDGGSLGTARGAASAGAEAGAEEPGGGGDDASVAPRARATATATATATAARHDEGPEAEVKLVERAQDALRARPAEALALCDEHARRFPSGMVTQECEVIAVEALVKLGRRGEAKARAGRFKARFPGAAAGRRLDVLLDD